ncbi:heparanase-like protein 3 [Arachis stenosperma]|uniref:heparanase-like protein 3 n=1 Tax=Arachis stenosperma TaxID=217475 RepID=UPI0025ABABE0|nr:heparanase-like protein 3 [Arachis stenosperma]
MKVLSASSLLVLSAKGYTGDKENLGKYEQVYFRAKVIFGLNALAGRTLQSGSAVGPWNSSNAESFICYTVRKNYSIAGWEFGNELCGSGVGANVSADQYASDIAALRNIFHDVYRGIRHKPLIIAPGGFYDANWFQEFINKSGKSVDVVSHHIYNLGAGVDEHLIERILDPSYLDGVASTFSGLKNILQKSATKAKAWVGEAGGTYNNGHHLVSDAFVYSFWYLDQLGMSTVYDTRTYCRQSVVGENYDLLNTSTFMPNPDYYSCLPDPQDPQLDSSRIVF